MKGVAEDREPAPILQANHDEHASERVESLLGPVPVMVDELIRQSGLSAAEVQLALLELDLAGRLDRHAGQKVSLR